MPMIQKRNVLILTQCFPPDVGGIENMMGSLAHALAEAGTNLTVLADGPKDSKDGQFPFLLRRFDGFKPLRRWRKGRAATHVIRSGKADVIIADSWKSLEYLDKGAARQAGAKVIVLAHGMEFPARVSGKKAARIRSAFAKADEIVANSHYTAAQCAPYQQRNVLRVATPPILPQPAPSPERLDALRSRYGDALNIMSLCRLEPRKGIDKLIEAVAALRQDFPQIKLHVAGSGPDRERLQSLAQRLEIGDAVVFHGRVSDAEKAALYAISDIFAMPARREGSSVEGFGIVYLEAAWYGTPSIAGSEGGASDAVHDGETGIICDGQETTAVRQALQTLLSSPELRARLGENARRRAHAQIWSERLVDYLPPQTNTAKPRILQLLPALGDGGVERSAVEMAGYLSSKGISNWIASAGGPLAAQAETLGARHVEIAVGSKSPFGMFAAARKIARLIDAEQIDIVHARSRAPAWVALIALKLARRKAHYITTFHGVYSHGNALKRFYNSAMLRTPVVIANSLFIRDHIISVYGYPAAQIVVAPRGIEPALFDPATISAEQRARVRAELGGSRRPLVVMVGRITGWKGHTVLVDAIARLTHKDVDFAFVGSGIDNVIAELKTKVTTLGIADRVHFAGSRRDIPAVLAAADLAISASTRPEAFGRAAIEAQAMGVPVIATDHGGSRETVIPGKTGWLVTPGDADAMASAIDEALADPARCAEMGASGRANVLAHFTTEAMLEKEFSGYTRVLARTVPR